MPVLFGGGSPFSWGLLQSETAVSKRRRSHFIVFVLCFLFFLEGFPGFETSPRLGGFAAW